MNTLTFAERSKYLAKLNETDKTVRAENIARIHSWKPMNKNYLNNIYIDLIERKKKGPHFKYAPVEHKDYDKWHERINALIACLKEQICDM